MSKIQKAIREIRKPKDGDDRSESGRPAIGTLIETSPGHRDAQAEEASVGSDTLELAALDSSKVAPRIHIDVDALHAAGFVAPDEENRALVDQYRHIKRPLLAHAFGVRATKVEDGHIILVSSALPGDGKTFSCINLALSLARERDRSVLLVDADVVKGHISQLFGMADQPGLLDLLERDSKFDLKDAVLSTDIEGLSVLASGKMRPHSTELLASKRMESLLRALGTQNSNRVIIIDSPPLLSTSEARVLATLAGQIVLIVCAGITPQSAVLDTIDLIDESKAVNLVLNQARGDSEMDYYGGYGAYSRDSAGGDDET